MPHHHNPLDPRDPYFVPFYLTFMHDNERRNGDRGPRRNAGGPGRGRFLLLALAVSCVVWLLSSY